MRHKVWLVVLASVLPYLPALANGFAMDDGLVARSTLPDGSPNPLVGTLRAPWTYFAAHYWQGTQEGSDLYRPLTVFSYALLRPLGDEACVQHAGNLLLHGLAVWLVLGLLAALGVGGTARLLGGLVFGLHAVHSEVVAGIVGRAELLAFTAGAAAASLALAGGTRRAIAAAALLLAALCSKESAVAWVPFLAVLGLARGEAVPPALWRAFRIGALPLAIYLLLRWQVLAGLPVPPIDYLANPLWHEPPATRVATALVVWAVALGKTVLPLGLAADYSAHAFALRTSLLDPGAVGALLLLTGLVGLGLWVWRRRPHWFLAMATFFGFTCVTSNVPFAIGTIFGERLLYAGSLGLVWLVPTLARGRIGRLAILAWCLFGAGVIVQRNGIWKDDMTLFSTEVERQPRSARLQAGVGQLLQDRGQLPAALTCFERASRCAPESVSIWSRLGAIALDSGDLVRAEQAFSRGLEALAARPRQDALVFRANYARLLQAQRRSAEAVTQLRLALAARPTSLLLRHELLQAGQGVLAESEIERLLAEGERLHPRAPQLALHRGYLLLRRGDAAGAERELLRALAAEPRHPGANLALATALQRQGQAAKARQILQLLADDEHQAPAVRQTARDRLR